MRHHPIIMRRKRVLFVWAKATQERALTRHTCASNNEILAQQSFLNLYGVHLHFYQVITQRHVTNNLYKELNPNAITAVLITPIRAGSNS